MNDPASPSTVSDSRAAAPELSPDFCAVLVLDQEGRVRTANPSALALWQCAIGDIVGQSFATLFAFEITSTDPEFLSAQWEAILASTLNHGARLALQPRTGATRAGIVRLETDAAAGGYIATVQPPKAPALPGPAGNGDHNGEALPLLVQHGATGFFDLNLRAGRYYFSPSWKKLLGYAPSELPDTLERWHELIHPDDSAAAPDQLPRKTATNGSAARPFAVEFRMRHQRGHWIWVQCTGVQMLGEDGGVDRVIGLHLDITDRKELEEASLANDARLQDLSGAGPLAAFELDFAQQSFWYSPAWERLLGYPEGSLEPTAAAFGNALPAEEAAMGVEAWLLQRAPGQTSFVEAVRLRREDGQPLPAVLGICRTVSRKRELLRVVGFAAPLPADALTTERALPGELANEAFDVLAEAVVVTDPRGRILYANQTAGRLLQTAADELRGQPVADVVRLVNRQSHRVTDDPIDRALSADQPLPLISADALASPGDTTPPVPVVWTARGVFGPDGKARAVVLVFRNPEEMTLTPEELVKANRFESLGLLAGGIAHDFNNLLTTILGAVSLAKDNRDYSALDDGEKACLTAKGLTKQLLAFAKGGAGTKTVCPANDILADAIKIAGAASTAEIALDVAADTEPVLVDRAQILQVFQNLIVNALQAMPPAPHRPRIQVRAGNAVLADQQISGLPAGNYVELEVRDNGTGIKPEHVEKIFDPFFTTKKHGTGLGLATVLSIVRKHGGQIALDTQVGVGTAFTVYLPKAETPVEIQARRAPSLRFGTGRVLFMDDDPKIAALTATMLQSLDYKYDLAKNGEEAITLYKRYLNIGRPYDAVIMDITVVGGMGGEECFGELKKIDPEVRAIVASGYDNDEMAAQFMAKGFCGYLTKPYRVNELGKVLKTVLG